MDVVSPGLRARTLAVARREPAAYTLGERDVAFAPAGARALVVPTVEQELVANPNCVAFATAADRLFGRAGDRDLPPRDPAARSWAELQTLASEVILPFHRETSLPSMGGYAWRVALTRRNERITQGLLYVALDGPATAAHLDALEEAVAGLGLGFGPGSIERVPVNGATAVLAADGRCSGVWGRDPADAPPWIRKLELDATGAVRAVLADGKDERDWARALPQVIGVVPPYGEAEKEIERMRLAFALHFTRRIVEADGVVRDGEAEFLTTVFPPDLIRRLGLDEAPAQAEYYDAAVERLRTALGHHDKLALVGLFFSACFSDGTLDAREMRTLKDAGETLGLTREQVVKYLRRFW